MKSICRNVEERNISKHWHSHMKHIRQNARFPRCVSIWSSNHHIFHLHLFPLVQFQCCQFDSSSNPPYTWHDQPSTCWSPRSTRQPCHSPSGERSLTLAQKENPKRKLLRTGTLSLTISAGKTQPIIFPQDNLRSVSVGSLRCEVLKISRLISLRGFPSREWGGKRSTFFCGSTYLGPRSSRGAGAKRFRWVLVFGFKGVGRHVGNFQNLTSLSPLLLWSRCALERTHGSWLTTWPAAGATPPACDLGLHHMAAILDVHAGIDFATQRLPLGFGSSWRISRNCGRCKILLSNKHVTELCDLVNV